MKIKESDIPALILKGEEKKAISNLYNEVFPKVKKFISSRNGISDDAYDIFQDGLVFFYNQVMKNEFDRKYNVYGYLFKVCINRWLNKIKRDKKIQLTEDLLSFDQGTMPSTINDMNYVRPEKKQEELIKKLFSDLGEKCKSVLTFSIFYDLSIEDIQSRVDMKSEGAVKMKLKRCKEKLQSKLSEDPQLLNLLKDNV